MTAWILAAILSLHPEMISREADLGSLAEAIDAASESRADCALLIALSWHESGHTFRADLEGDSGESITPWQIRVCRRGDDRCGRARTDLVYAARLALAMAHASMRACRAYGVENSLAIYATGACQRNHEARVRWHTAQRLLRTTEDAS